MNDFLKNLQDVFIARVKNMLLMNFVLAWCIVNYKVTFQVLFGNMNIDNKILYIEHLNLGLWSGILLPLIITAIYIYIIPLTNLGVLYIYNETVDKLVKNHKIDRLKQHYQDNKSVEEARLYGTEFVKEEISIKLKKKANEEKEKANVLLKEENEEKEKANILLKEENEENEKANILLKEENEENEKKLNLQKENYNELQNKVETLEIERKENLLIREEIREEIKELENTRRLLENNIKLKEHNLKTSSLTNSNKKVTTPKINNLGDALHKVNIPKFKIPTVNIPKIKIPAVDIPKIKIPTADIPKIKIPTADIPKIKIPTADIF